MENQKQIKEGDLEKQIRLEKEITKGNGRDKEKFFLPLSIIIAALIIGGAVLYVGFSPNSKKSPNEKSINQPNEKGLGRQTNETSGSLVSIDDDPILGNQDAPITIIEFSDYECPFCKRSFEEMLPQLKKEYIEKGKVRLVYRDFPLSFHENAHKEAQAAECAREQGGDAVYFKYHDQIFTRTTSNGTGLSLAQLPVIAESLGLDIAKFQECLDSEKFKNEVDKDFADGISAGVSGTPSWFIGKSTQDGVINGTLLVGAQPFSAFKEVIERMLSE